MVADANAVREDTGEVEERLRDLNSPISYGEVARAEFTADQLIDFVQVRLMRYVEVPGEAGILERVYPLDLVLSTPAGSDSNPMVRAGDALVFESGAE